MKALVYTGARTLDYREVPDPQPDEGEELIRIARVGICGSDMHAWLGHDERRPAPLILGHEAAGMIVGGARDGERVTINPLATCSGCRACNEGRENLCPQRQIISMPPREGAFAELLAMPARNLVSVPDAVPLSHAALTEPMACGWHAVRLGREALGAAAEGARALVYGGGAIGFGTSLCLRAQGIDAITLVEANPLRRAELMQVCGQVSVAPDAIPTDTPYDLVVDGVGIAATRASASALVRPGGVIVHIGLGDAEGGLDVRRLTLQEITFIGTYTFTRQDFRDTAQAIFDGRLGPLDWMQTRPLSAGVQAFDDIHSGAVAAPKILLTPETAPADRPDY